MSSDRFAGGALMDLGIYPLRCRSSFFGKAQIATYQAQQLDNSMDLNGDVTFLHRLSSSYQGWEKHHFQSSLRDLYDRWYL